MRWLLMGSFTMLNLTYIAALSWEIPKQIAEQNCKAMPKKHVITVLWHNPVHSSNAFCGKNPNTLAIDSSKAIYAVIPRESRAAIKDGVAFRLGISPLSSTLLTVQAHDKVRFQDVTNDVGTAEVGFGWHGYHDAITGADWDADGDVDLLVCVSPHDTGPHKGSARLFLNLLKETGNFSLSDSTEKLMPNGINKYCFADSCPFFMDIDADGDLDIASISDEMRPAVFRNNGKGIFSLERWGFSAQACIVKDIDEDGDLDVIGEDTGIVYLNDGTGKYIPKSKALSGHMPRDKILPVPSGITVDEETKRLAASSGHVYYRWEERDFNGDGLMDYILHLSQAYGFKLARFYARQPDGGFKDVSAATGLPLNAALGFVELSPGEPEAVFAGVNGPEAGFYLGDGKGHFTKAERSDVDGFLRITSGGCYSLPQVFVDFDNDGILDLVTYQPRVGAGSAVFRGLGNGRFELVLRTKSGSGQFVADMDNDGRVDIVGSGAKGVRVWRNVSDPSGAWLRVILRGTGKNTFAVNAVVTAYPAGELGHERRAIARARAGTAGLPLHLGLGNHRLVDLRVTFPDGKVVDRTAVKTNQTITIEQ
ncbi:MAG: CRTAC1 family protein [Armatimonadota bacterium]|nr:CRTAC1 family protein [Armatimonadota bacterium]MDW8026477.1 CRTAC1 family protein [Armatimonadota bacterium]